MSRHEDFVVHTHPVVNSAPEHFRLDMANAGDRIEAVVDWAGNVTYYNRHGIVADPPEQLINELGYVVGRRPVGRP